MKQTKSQIIKILVEQTGVPKKQIETILNEYLLTIREIVSNGESFNWRNFGTFYLKERKPRKIRDFSTGESRTVFLGPIPAFRPSKKLYQIDIGNNQQTIPNHPPKQLEIETKDGCIIIKSSANPEQTQDSYIKFVPRIEFENKDRYPIICMPKEKSFLKLPRQGRSDTRGYKEVEFTELLKSFDLNIEINDNCHLTIEGRYSPYEPDIVLFDKSLGLFIDVEIDEPYDGYSRLVTHNIEGVDDIRNRFFCESGWVVIRFTEYQVHTNPNGCINVIKNVLRGLKEGVVNNDNFLKTEDRWDIKQAIEWERDLYREKYLGIQGFSKKIRHQRIVCLEDDNVENLINRTPIHNSKGHIIENQKLIFDEETHTYYPSNNQSGNADAISVTTLIDKFFPYFDKEAYIQKKILETGETRECIEKELNQPALDGTYMHKQFELFLKGQPCDDDFKEFQLFRDFYYREIKGRNLEFYDAEKSIILPNYNIAGTVDALFKKSNDEFIIVDWKRSTNLIIDGYPKKYGYGMGLSVLNHLDNSSYYKYELQQSFYKYILEKEYGMRISSMILAVIHPKYDRYYAIKLSNYREKEIINMLEVIDMINN